MPEPRRERIEIAVGKAREAGARQDRGIVQACVIEPVPNTSASRSQNAVTMPRFAA
jgi:hypothetical protein